MAEIFLVELEIQCNGLTHDDFLKVWCQQAECLVDDRFKYCKITGKWKLVGERKVFIIIEINGDLLDQFLFTMPIIKQLGSQVNVTVTPLFAYETFANNLNAMEGNDTRYDKVATVDSGSNIHYLLDIGIEYKGMTQEELLKIWCEEIAFALGAKEAGVVVDIWKCVAMRRIIVIVCVDSPAKIDSISLNLPMMKKMGNNMFMKLKRIRKYESFYEDLKNLTSS